MRLPRRPWLAAVALLLAPLAPPARAGDPPPAPAGEPGSGPRAAFDRLEHDWGIVAQEKELRTEFRLKNEGGSVLKVTDLRADCGCAAATIESREIPPGGSLPILVALRTLTMSGPLSKRIFVRTDDPGRPFTELRLRADISAGVILDPARLFFGEVLAGTKPTATMRAKWRDGAGEPFHVTSVETPGLDLEVETKPFDEPPWHGVEVRATFRSPPKVGNLGATAILRTDAPGRERILVGVQAFVSGRVWLDRRAVTLGMVPAGTSRQVAVICRPFGQGTDLGKVTASSRKGLVEAKAVPSGKEWVVTIRLPETAAPGEVEDVVEVRSSIPEEPAAEISVKGFVTGAPK